MLFINIFKWLTKEIFQVQNEVYVSLADAIGQNWSIKFPTSENVSLFCIHLSIVKALLSQYEVITQDIVIGSGNVRYFY